MIKVVHVFLLSAQQEIEKLQEMAKKLKGEISELTNGLFLISAECQEVTEENNSLMVNHPNHTNLLLTCSYLCRLLG